MSDMPYISSIAIRSGKTHAICEAAKKIGATVIVHSRHEAERLSREHGVLAVPYNANLRGTRGPYLVDTHAVSVMAGSYEDKIERLQRQLSAAQAMRTQLLELFQGIVPESVKQFDEASGGDK